MANFVLLGVIMSLVFGEISAATIQNCKTHTGNQMWIDVDETKASPIICTVSSASKTFSWQVSESGRHYTDIGMCSSSENGEASCESFEDDVNFSLSHLSQSEMTIVANHRKYNNKYVRCVADDPEYVCQIRITHPAQPTQCSLSVLADGPTATGSCYIGKTFSSDNTYSCLWYILYPGGVSRERLASVFIRTPYLDEGKEYCRAVCAFSFPFNVGFGMYTFYISFTPGPTEESAGTVTVPSSTQSQQIVPSFTFYSVGYKQMVLDAEASEVAPSPNYTWSGVICNNISAKCIFTPKQEDDNKVVTCMAVFNNARYEGQIVKTRFKLTVHIEPPDPPVITGHCPGQVYRIWDALTLLCIVKGGTPKAKILTFFCGEHKGSEGVVHQTAVFSVVIIDSLSETDNGTVCNCSARWEKDPTISLTTSITLIVEGQPAPTTIYIDTSSKDTNEGGAEESTFPVAAVAGGIGALLAIIGIVIVIIIVVRRLRMKTYDRPNFRRDQDTNPYTGLRPTGTDSSRIFGTANAQSGNEEGQQVASNPRGRLQMPPTDANELRDISNTAASAHAYQNTLQSSAN